MLMPRAWVEISVPGTRVTPVAGTAAAASAQPAVVSWSVRATTSSPAEAASSSTAAGGEVPSEAVEWTWRSIRTEATLEAGCDAPGLSPGSLQARRERSVWQVEHVVRVAGVAQLELLKQDRRRRARPGEGPEPDAGRLAHEGGDAVDVHGPQRGVVAGRDELEARGAADDPPSGVEGLQAGEPGTEPDPGLLGDEEQVRREVVELDGERVRAGAGEHRRHGSGVLVARVLDPRDEPPEWQRPRHPDRHLRAGTELAQRVLGPDHRRGARRDGRAHPGGPGGRPQARGAGPPPPHPAG